MLTEVINSESEPENTEIWSKNHQVLISVSFLTLLCISICTNVNTAPVPLKHSMDGPVGTKLF